MTNPITGVKIVDKTGTINKAAPNPRKPLKKPPKATVIMQIINSIYESSMFQTSFEIKKIKNTFLGRKINRKFIL